MMNDLLDQTIHGIADYAPRIERIVLELGTTTREMAELRERLVEIEVVEILSIAAQRNDDGKPLYSNEATRHAALTLRLKDSDLYAEIKAAIATAETRRTELTARLERWRNDFKLALVERQEEATVGA